ASAARHGEAEALLVLAQEQTHRVRPRARKRRADEAVALRGLELLVALDVRIEDLEPGDTNVAPAQNVVLLPARVALESERVGIAGEEQVEDTGIDVPPAVVVVEGGRSGKVN